jgi:hypothetical protein
MSACPPLSSSSVAMTKKLSVPPPPPRDLWPISLVTGEDLQALVDEGLLHPRSYEAHP